jgi:hypothetical protein
VKIRIDVSIFSSPIAAYGNVSGPIDLVAVPSVGNTVSFLSPKNGVPGIQVSGFSGVLKVTDVRFSPNSPTDPVSVCLEDVVTESVGAAQEVMGFLESGFDLFAVQYDQQPSDKSKYSRSGTD